MTALILFKVFFNRKLIFEKYKIDNLPKVFKSFPEDLKDHPGLFKLLTNSSFS